VYCFLPFKIIHGRLLVTSQIIFKVVSFSYRVD
jgi:hypothetical protein